MTSPLFTTLIALAVSIIPQPKSVEFGDKASDGKKVIEQVSEKLQVPESYTITIKPHKVLLEGADEAGLFYARQTLLQLQEAGELKCGKIEDAPRFAWRGFMLDEARHFMGTEYVKKVLDVMARYKMNRFHWHLTDGQGWRIEIKKYPNLTIEGAKGCHSNPNAPAKFYTQEQIREIVEYAAKLHIEVIPEIDMPGHATASNRAYPEYNGGGSERYPDFTFNPGKEEVYQYLTDILREVAALFPSRYLCIGADEVSFGSAAWGNDPYVQDLIKREHLDGIKGAENYFVRRMVGVVNSLGKEAMVWDDALKAQPDKNGTLMMWWRHDHPETARKIAAEGYRQILCPRRPMYFDFTQHESHRLGRFWTGYCPYDDVYMFPDKLGMTEEEMKSVLGVQCNLWTEWVGDHKRADYMIFPRLIAAAEAGWTSRENKSVESFNKNMEAAFRYLDSKGIYYFDFRNPARTPEPPMPEFIGVPAPVLNYWD